LVSFEMNNKYKNALCKSRLVRILAMNCVAITLLAVVKIAGPSAIRHPESQAGSSWQRIMSKLHVDLRQPGSNGAPRSQSGRFI
jgi:hypothetical protein